MYSVKCEHKWTPRSFITSGEGCSYCLHIRCSGPHGLWVGSQGCAQAVALWLCCVTDGVWATGLEHFHSTRVQVGLQAEEQGGVGQSWTLSSHKKTLGSLHYAVIADNPCLVWLLARGTMPPYCGHPESSNSFQFMFKYTHPVNFPHLGLCLAHSRSSITVE